MEGEEIKERKAKEDIEKLIYYSLQHKLIEEEDIQLSRNLLFEIFFIKAPLEYELHFGEYLENPEEILESLLNYAVDTQIIQNSIIEKDLLDSKIMGVFISKQSEIIRKFNKIREKKSIEKATEYFYQLSKSSNYIRTERIKKNKYWKINGEFGEIEITINLSKPEKDPKDIAKLQNQKSSGYPKCALCIENVGFAGNFFFSARQNHRVIPFSLSSDNHSNNTNNNNDNNDDEDDNNGEDSDDGWPNVKKSKKKNYFSDSVEDEDNNNNNNEEEKYYFQYSPYEYYREHCILIDKTHRPMQMNRKSITNLFSLLKIFPHYMIGSNAELPIVGGSILTHNHFQGGKKIFPIDNSPIDRSFTSSQFNDVKISIIRWYLSVIRLSSKNYFNLIELSLMILEKWRNYSNEEINIHSFSIIEEIKIPHNTITPIVRINKEKEYEIDLILRNNRTTKEYPYGIFHPHSDLHHIKKENIGLIEAMGLAILPGRLDLEIEEIKEILMGKNKYFREEISEGSNLFIHRDWIEYLIGKFGTKCSEEEGNVILREEIGIKFARVLMDSAVFKSNLLGRSSFHLFLTSHLSFLPL